MYDPVHSAMTTATFPPYVYQIEEIIYKQIPF